MSRLFSRLENIAAGPGDSGPATPDAQAVAPAAGPALSGAGVAPSILPGYAISSRLAIAPASPVPAPVWPLRLWFFSLVFLIALSLLMLVVPERLYTSSPQQQAPLVPQPQAAALYPAPAAPASAPVVEAPPSPAAVRTPAPPPASVPPPRPEPRIIAAPVVPAPVQAQQAVPATGAAACSEAMVALSLCTPISP